MEILIKKGSNGDASTTSIKEIAELLEITPLRVQIRKMIESLESLKNVPKLTKKDVLDMLIGEFLTKEIAINLSQPGSIEKQKNVPLGIIYYNEVLDKLRLHSKNGWVDVN
jgi:hypothetical protein